MEGDNPFGATGTGEEDRPSLSSGGGGGQRRGNVHVKGLYGTETFPPDTECWRCNRRAVGVWIKEESYGTEDIATTKTGEKGEPLCGVHRDRVKSADTRLWEKTEFRRFVD